RRRLDLAHRHPAPTPPPPPPAVGRGPPRPPRPGPPDGGGHVRPGGDEGGGGGGREGVGRVRRVDPAGPGPGAAPDPASRAATRGARSLPVALAANTTAR